MCRARETRVKEPASRSSTRAACQVTVTSSTATRVRNRSLHANGGVHAGARCNATAQQPPAETRSARTLLTQPPDQGIRSAETRAYGREGTGSAPLLPGETR